jgi:hypothetical protein
MPLKQEKEKNDIVLNPTSDLASDLDNKENMTLGMKNEDLERQHFIFVFYPSMYDSFFYLGFLKILEKSNIKVDKYLSCGISSLIMHLYSKHQTSSLVEWNIFQLNKKIKNARAEIFDSKWDSVVKDFLTHEKNKMERLDKRTEQLFFKDYCLNIMLDELDENKTRSLVKTFDNFNFNKSTLLDEIKKSPKTRMIFIRPNFSKNKMLNNFFRKIDIDMNNLSRTHANIEIKNIENPHSLNSSNIENIENFVLEGEQEGKQLIDDLIRK